MKYENQLIVEIMTISDQHSFRYGVVNGEIWAYFIFSKKIFYVTIQHNIISIKQLQQSP